jgi:NADPH:quinone reductase-like Zn-dependent oxidoreductase
MRPITTCAPAHFDLVTRFGAEKAFDRYSSTVAAEIREYTDGELEHALDCVTQVDTTKMCYEALGRAGGRYVALEPPNPAVLQTRSNTVKASWVLAFTTFGLEVPLDGEYYREARPDERALNAQGLRIVERLLPRGLIDPHPIRILSGGLEGVVRGVETIATQPPSGYKMVYPIDTL